MVESVSSHLFISQMYKLRIRETRPWHQVTQEVGDESPSPLQGVILFPTLPLSTRRVRRFKITVLLACLLPSLLNLTCGTKVLFVEDFSYFRNQNKL